MTIDEALQAAYQHHHAGKLAEAEAIYRQILAQVPGNAGALHMLGVLAGQVGQTDAAIELIEKSIASNPNQAIYYGNLVALLLRKGRVEEAVTAARRAVELAAGAGGGVHHFNLANALRAKGMLREAAEACGEAIRLEPGHEGAHQNLLSILEVLGDREGAVAAGRQAVRLLRNHVLGYFLLGNALQFDDQYDAAGEAYEQVLRLEPGHLEALVNLGYGLKEVGRTAEAIGCYRKVLERVPGGGGVAAAVHSNLLYALHFLPESTRQSLAVEHVAWNLRHAVPLEKEIAPHGNVRDAERRLRVGYVSPDFREHAVGRMILPLLAGHDHAGFEVFCYSGVRREDGMTERIRRHADVWRPTAGMSDEAVAEMVRADGIDILVDLTMHMAGNRELLFARKPAPVQVSYLAYCSTTGMMAGGGMDYRLSDPYLDPAGSDVTCYAEETVRLPETYWCYLEPEAAPEVGALPAAGAGYVTFGCLNNFCKVSEAALEVWAEILRKVAGSRLVLHAREGRHRERVRGFLAQRGVGGERVEFVGMLPAGDYFAQYQRVDVGLDPFPYAGGTTTCDALYMGVPVVTLGGETAVGRGGVSILTNVGMEELVAATAAEYVRIAVELAGDGGRLRAVRAELRGCVKRSVLMEGGRFARHVESAYREMWRKWCGRD